MERTTERTESPSRFFSHFYIYFFHFHVLSALYSTINYANAFDFTN